MLEPIKEIFVKSSLSRIFISQKITEALEKDFGFSVKVVITDNQIKVVTRKKTELFILVNNKDKVRQIIFSTAQLKPNIFVRITLGK